MPFPYQYQNQSGFGANSFVAAANPSPAANPMGNYTAASRVGMPTATASAPASTSSSLNVSAGSRSLNPFGGAGIPDLSYADPNTLNRLNISNLIYSAPAGGYIYGGDNHYIGGSYPANSGGDPRANRQAAAYFNYIGSLPTMQRGSPALMQLNAASGVRGSGPSLNSQVQGFFNTAPAYVRDTALGAGFNPSGYQGPYTFGRRNAGQGGFNTLNLNRY